MFSIIDAEILSVFLLQENNLIQWMTGDYLRLLSYAHGQVKVDVYECVISSDCLLLCAS